MSGEEGYCRYLGGTDPARRSRRCRQAVRQSHMELYGSQ